MNHNLLKSLNPFWNGLLDIWKNPKYWPKDRSGEYVSLFEATIRIGAARFQTEWTGEEPYAPALYNAHEELSVGEEILIMAKPNLTAHDMKQLYWLLFHKRPDLELPFPSSTNLSYNLTDEQTDIALRLASVVDAERIRLHDRMNEVIEIIAEAISQKHLGWALANGGQFTMMHSTNAWRNGEIKQRFIWGTMNPYTTHSPGIWGEGYANIFFSSEDAGRLIDEIHRKNACPTSIKPADRSVKSIIADKQLQEWTDRYFAQFKEPDGPKMAEAEASYRKSFPKAGTPQFRNKVWPRRPHWMPRRAPKGA